MQLLPLMTVTVEVEPIQSAGPTPSGEIRVVTFIHGTFEGPELRGKLLPGGTDWQRVRPDGVVEISARYMLETDRGERIEVVSTGLRQVSATVLERIERGENVEPHEYYFRTSVRLATASPRLERLNRILVVTSGERTKGTVRVKMFEVP